ncbi:MAG: hypothetical protein QXJ32_03180 [Thermoplasmata archaeon]
MPSEDDLISSLLKGTKSMLSSETMLVEAVQDLVKDEIKRHIRQKLDASPELKEELKAAVEELLEAKVREAYALLKVTKVGAKLGIELVPPKLRKEIGQELVSMFEREVTRMFDQA